MLQLANMLQVALLACLLYSSWAWPVFRHQANLEKNATSPFSLDWDNTIAICAIMRQENLEDLREWLQYHRCAFLCPETLAFSVPLTGVDAGTHESDYLRLAHRVSWNSYAEYEGQNVIHLVSYPVSLP